MLRLEPCVLCKDEDMSFMFAFLPIFGGSHIDIILVLAVTIRTLKSLLPSLRLNLC